MLGVAWRAARSWTALTCRLLPGLAPVSFLTFLGVCGSDSDLPLDTFPPGVLRKRRAWRIPDLRRNSGSPLTDPMALWRGVSGHSLDREMLPPPVSASVSCWHLVGRKRGEGRTWCLPTEVGQC